MRGNSCPASKNAHPRRRGTSKQPTSTRRDFLRKGALATLGAGAALYVKPAINSVGVPKAFASASPAPLLTPLPPQTICIDFDEPFVREGDVIREQYSSYGFKVSTQNYWGFDNPHHPAVIFNSSQPTGGDYDLGSPNVEFGGPGLGSGGGPGP